MKVAFCSDLHLEMCGVNFEFPEADVLLLAGDICQIYDLRESFSETLVGARCREFFKMISAKYKNVIYVPGNHDHWGTAFYDIDKIFNQFCLEEGLNSITFNYKGVLDIEDVRFVYATLWTDYKKDDPIVKYNAQRNMNDYTRIDFRDYLFRTVLPDDISKIHREHRTHISDHIKGHNKVVVMTHHAPSMYSLYDADSSMSYFYACTDMDEIIFENPQIKYVIHGHTHEEVDYMLCDTRVMTNCRGYYENEFEVKVFEI